MAALPRAPVALEITKSRRFLSSTLRREKELRGSPGTKEMWCRKQIGGGQGLREAERRSDNLRG